MAQKRISDLPAAVFADLTGTDVMEVSDLGAALPLQSKKVTLDLLRQFMLTAATVLTSLTLGAAGAAYGVSGTATAVAVDAVAGAITHTANLSRGAGAPGTFVFKVGGVLGSSNTLQTAATVLTIGDQVTTFVGSFRSLVGKIGLGTTPGTTAAINVDTATHADSGILVTKSGGTVTAIWGSTTTQAYIGTSSAHDFTLIAQSGQSKWRVGGATTVAELIAGQVTARIVMGSTNGIAFRNAANSADRFSIDDAGTQWILTNGVQGLQGLVIVANGDALAGGVLTNNTTGGSTYVSTRLVGTTSEAGIGYYDGTVRRIAAKVTNVASGFGTLSLMQAGGNVVIGGTAAGATASGVLAFGTTAATEPTATVDLVQLYGFDFGAGQRALGVFQEYAPYAGVAVASTHRWPVRINGVAYYVLITTVA